MEARLKYILFSVLLFYASCCGPGFYKRGNSCIPCHSGYYSSKNNANECQECPPNTYAFSGASSCTPCPEGFINHSDKSHCYPCGAGRYLDKQSNRCSNCPSGTFSNSGASKCEDCPAGTYSGAGALNCIPCPAGKTSKKRSFSCEKCPAGTFSGSGSSFCHSCPMGTYSSSGSSACYYCDPGQKTKKDQSGCELCPEGTYSSSGASECTKCPSGTYSKKGANKCLPLNEGTKSDEEGSSYDKICPKGTFSFYFNDSIKCYNCLNGTYSKEGSSNCETCEEGTMVNKEKSGCKYCPKGTYSPSRSEKCHKCPPGTYSLTSYSSCSVCREGTKSNKDNTGCDSCPAGTYAPSNSGKCYECPVGTYSNSGYSSCTPCYEGYYSDTEGSSKCLKCPINTYSYRGSTYCFKCQKGSDYCTGHIETKDDIPERYNLYQKEIEYIGLRDFGSLLSAGLFGVNVEFKNSFEVTFQIPGYTVTETVYNQVIFELKGDVEFKIENNEIKDITSGNELAKNIKEFLEKLEKSMKGKLEVGYTYLETKLCKTVSSGEVYISFDFLKKTLEITIVSKYKQGISENIIGVKFTITPRIDFGYLYQKVALAVVTVKAPEFISSIRDMTYEFINEFLRGISQVNLNWQIIIAFTVALCSLVFLAVA